VSFLCFFFVGVIIIPHLTGVCQEAYTSKNEKEVDITMVLANVTVKASQWVYDRVNEVKVSTGLTQQEALDLIFRDYISTISALQIKFENLEKEYKKLQEERDNLKKSLDEKNSELSKCLKALKG